MSLRPLIQDPIGVFSAEWLAQNFNTDVLILVRHPYAFAGSLKRIEWKFDFRNFLDQPELMERHLKPYEEEIREYARTEHAVLEQAALFWKCIYSVVMKYQDHHKNWLIVRHEDLSLEPAAQFKRIFSHL